MRKNGLQKPYNFMQLTTWAVFPILLLHFLLCLTVIFPVGISVPFTLIFLTAAFLSFYYSSLTCLTDPIDDKLFKYLHPDERAPNPKQSCTSKLCHIPHPLEKKKINQQSPTRNDNSDHPDDRHDPETASVLNKKVFRTSPRKLMQRSMKEGFFNASGNSVTEQTDKDNGKSTKTLLGLSRMSRDQKQAETNFKNESTSDRKGVSNSGEDDSQNLQEDTKFCWVCSTQVHVHSMHCKFCDKCVSKFDHHCMWLNTCVGERNYDFFFKTVVSTFVFILVHILSLFVFFIGYTAGGSDGVIYRNSEDWFLVKNKPWLVLVVNVLVLIATIATLCLVGQLLLFHLNLRRENITTYEFIVRDNARKRDLTKLEAEIKSRRIMAIGKAQREGKTVQKMILVCGEKKCFECYDPIRKEVLREHDQEQRQAARTNNGGHPVGLQSTVDEDDDVEDVETGTQQRSFQTNKQKQKDSTRQVAGIPSSNDSKFSSASSDTQQPSLSGMAAMRLKNYNSLEHQSEFKQDQFPFPVNNTFQKNLTNKHVVNSHAPRSSHSNNAIQHEQTSVSGLPKFMPVAKTSQQERDENAAVNRSKFPVPSKIEFDDEDTIDASSIDATLTGSPTTRIAPKLSQKETSEYIQNDYNQRLNTKR